MAYVRAVITGTKKLSIRKCPWSPLDDESMAYIDKSTPFYVDMEDKVYDWKGHKYYAYVKNGIRNGYVRADACNLEAERGGSRAK